MCSSDLGMVFLALLFSVNQYWSLSNPAAALDLLLHCTAAALLFCLLSSAEYLVNDVLDAPQDRLHPTKRNRPIASGLLPAPLALGAAAVLLVVGLVGCYLVTPLLAVVGAAYAGMMAAYSLGLKHQVIIDVFIIAGGFVLRAAAGAVEIGRAHV